MTGIRFPTRYLFFSELELKPDRFREFKEAATRIAGAFNRNLGIPWAAYTTFAGPTAAVNIMLPLASLGQLDSIPPVSKVVIDEYGEAEADRYLRGYQQAVVRVHSYILSYLEHASSYDGWGAEMPAFLYHTRIALRPDRVGQMDDAIRRIAAAHTRHERGLSWVGYGTLAGASLIHGFVPLRRLADLESVPQASAIVLEALGEREGAATLHEFERTILSSESAVLQYLGHYFGGNG